jgi:hypothetical protein
MSIKVEITDTAWCYEHGSLSMKDTCKKCIALNKKKEK